VRCDCCTAFKPDSHSSRARNLPLPDALISDFPGRPIMRWKISHHLGHGDHDPRQIDLIAIVALLIVIVTALRFYDSDTQAPSKADFIEPSQTVHW
jgi:hypothetical protein